MLFKPELKEAAKATGDGVAKVAGKARRRTVSIAVTLLILGGLGYIGWNAFQQRQTANRGGFRPDMMTVPVLSGDAEDPGRAGLSRWRRLGEGLEQCHRARTGRRQTDQGQFQGRSGRQGGRCARRD